MACFLRYCVFGLLSLSVLTAHAARTVIVQPGQLQPTYGPGVGPDAFIDSRDWNATISDQKGSRHTVPVVRQQKYTWPKFTSALKNALKLNPGRMAASATIGALFVGIDWIFDEGSQAIKKKQLTSADPTTSTTYWCWENANGGCIRRVTSVESARQAHIDGLNLVSDPGFKTWQRHTITNNSDTAYSFVARNHVGNTSTSYARRYGSCPGGWQPSGGICPVGDPTYEPVSPSEIDSFAGSISDPSAAAEIAPFISDSVPGSFDYPDSEAFGGPNSIDLPGEITTTTNPTTGDTTVVESLPSLQLEYGTDPLSITSTQTTVTNTYQNGTQTSTSVSTETNTTVESPALEVPTDCDFMPTVCSFIDWVKTPFNEPDPDLSELISDEDYSREINFSSNASCPAPSIISTSQGAYEFSWEPACQWAGMVKPLVIIAALIGAIFINLGMARGNE